VIVSLQKTWNKPLNPNGLLLRYLYELLKLESFGGMDFQWRDRDLSGFIKNISATEIY